MKQSLTLFCVFIISIFALLADYDAGLRAFDALRHGFEGMAGLAEQGHMTAQNALGYLVERGLGVQRDAQAAAKWYKNLVAEVCLDREILKALLIKNGLSS